MNWKLQITNYTFIIIACLFIGIAMSCNSDGAQECFRSMGDTVNYTIAVPGFSSINVSPGIELVIAEGDTQSVSVQTGANLKEYITAEVIDGKLYLKNTNNCNWVRQYNSTTITVITPQLNQIYSATQFTIRSAGTLHFPDLSIQSGIFSETASGLVSLDVDCNNLTIEDNQNLDCLITGSVENLIVSFYAGDARFDGTGLDAANVKVFHRSSNDVMVQASQQVTGTLYSTGNLVLLNHPPVVEVDRKYTGKIVYE